MSKLSLLLGREGETILKPRLELESLVVNHQLKQQRERERERERERTFDYYSY